MGKIHTNYNIFFLSEDYTPNQGGVAGFSSSLAASLASKGNNVSVITPHVTGDKQTDALRQISTTRIGERDIRHKQLGLFRRFRAVQKMRRQLHNWLKENCKKQKADFALVSSVSPWALNCYRLNIPYVVCVHGADAFGKRADWLRTLYRRAIVKRIFRHADLICANSKYTAGCIANLGNFQSKTILTYCGLDNSFLKIVQKFGSEPALSCIGKRLLIMARLIPMKGCDLVIDAIARLRSKHPEILLTIAGDGPTKESLQQQVYELGVSAHVKFVGYVSSIQAKVQLFSENDIFVQPGRFDSQTGRAEAFGIVFLEAGYSYMPSIGPNFGGPKEIIEHGKTGFLLEQNDINGLVQYLDHLLSAPDKIKEMGKAAHEKMVSSHLFNYDKIAESICAKIYKNSNSES